MQPKLLRVIAELILIYIFLCFSDIRWFRTWKAFCCFPQWYFFFLYCFGLSEQGEEASSANTGGMCWIQWDVCVCADFKPPPFLVPLDDTAHWCISLIIITHTWTRTRAHTHTHAPTQTNSYCVLLCLMRNSQERGFGCLKWLNVTSLTSLTSWWVSH